MRAGLLSLLLLSFLALTASAETPTCDLYEAELEVFNDQIKSLYKSTYDALELAKRSQNEKSEALDEKVTRILAEARKHADLASNSINQLKLHKECACENFDFPKIENSLIEIRFHIKKAMNVELKKKKQAAYESRTANTQAALDKASALQVYLLDPCAAPPEEAAPIDTTTEPEPVVVAVDTPETTGPELVIDEPDSIPEPGPELVEEEVKDTVPAGPELVVEEEPKEEPESTENSGSTEISAPTGAATAVVATGAAAVAAGGSEKEETQEEPVVEESAAEPVVETEEPEETPVEPEPVVEEPTPPATPVPATQATVSTGPEPAVYYALQIAASSSDQETGRFSNLGYEVYVVPEGGLYKYRVGKYPQFEEVVAVKNELFNKGFTDAFIVAYVDGQKVSVAEARSKQQSDFMSSSSSTSSQGSETKPYKDKKLKKKSNVFVAIQLGANVTQVDPIMEIIKYENIIQRDVKVLHGSPVRYYTGEFTNPKDAESLLNVIKLSGIPDAFLIGIADGERIEYQKAVEFLESRK